MRGIERVSTGLALAAAILAPGEAPPGSSGRLRVERASLVVVATLISSEVLTARGTDYGHGLLRVERVLHPSRLATDLLLLRWSNGAGARTGRVDPGAYEHEAALWLLTTDPDGAARIPDPLVAVPLSDTGALDRFVESLMPLTGGDYDDKVMAIEAFVDALPYDPPPGDRDTGTDLPDAIHARIDFALRDYLDYPLFKGLAAAIDDAGRWVYGYVHEMPDERIAAERALAECSTRAARTRVNAPCRLYALGNSIVWQERQGPD